MFVYHFKPSQDVDPDDPRNEFDCETADALVRKLITRTERAVRLSSLPEAQRSFFVAGLPLFDQTHGSIRSLCKDLYGPQGKTADALSLVREQIEKLFAFQLICEDPGRWVSAYLKEGWRSSYEMFLHQKSEQEQLPRCQEFINAQGCLYLEHIRKECGVTDAEKQAVELRFAGKSKSRLEFFPTPGRSIKHFTNDSRRSMMSRWHVEYLRYSSFSHALAEKLFLSSIQNRGGPVDEFMRRQILTKHIEPGLIISYLAIGCMVAEVNALLGQDHEVLELLSEFWDTFRRSSLYGVMFWEMRIKSLLPPIIGEPNLTSTRS